MDWVTELIAKIELAVNGILEVEINGQKITAHLGAETLKYLKANKAMLIRIGKETFRDFLMLIHEKRNEEAFQLLLDKMNADDMIVRLNMNAEELKNDNDLRDQFLASLRKFVTTVLSGVAVKVLVALIV